MVAIVARFPAYAKETKNEVLKTIVAAMQEAQKNSTASKNFLDYYYTMITSAENAGLGTALMIVSTTELDPSVRLQFCDAMAIQVLYEKFAQLVINGSDTSMESVEGAKNNLKEFITKAKEDPGERDTIKNITPTEKIALERKGTPGWADAPSRKALVELLVKQLQTNESYLEKFYRNKAIDDVICMKIVNLSVRTAFLIGAMQGLAYARKTDIDNIVIVYDGEKIDPMSIVTAAESRLNERKSFGDWMNKFIKKIKVNFPKALEEFIGPPQTTVEATVTAPKVHDESNAGINSGVYTQYLRSILGVR